MARIKPVQLVALHAGWVETAYTATILLYHDKGFKTLDDAVVSIMEAFKEACNEYRQQAEQDIEFWEREVARFHSAGARRCLEQVKQRSTMSDVDLAYAYAVSNNQSDISQPVFEALVQRGWNLALDSYRAEPVKLPKVYGVVDWPRLFDREYACQPQK